MPTTRNEMFAGVLAETDSDRVPRRIEETRAAIMERIDKLIDDPDRQPEHDSRPGPLKRQNRNLGKISTDSAAPQAAAIGSLPRPASQCKGPSEANSVVDPQHCSFGAKRHRRWRTDQARFRKSPRRRRRAAILDEHTGHNAFENHEISISRIFLPINFHTARSQGAELLVANHYCHLISYTERLALRRRKAKPLQATQKQYVFCPYCGDPAPGPFPQPGAFLECGQCFMSFPFDEKSVETGLLEFDQESKRWRPHRSG